MNQYYSAELAQKINRGLKESWTKGQTTGGKPVFGYDVVDKKCIINEYEANIIREAFTKYAQGYKAVAIVKMFKEKGYRRKNGMPIGEKYLYSLFHDKRYTGIVEHQGVVYDKIFPRIITDEVWQAVCAINDENKIAPSRKKEIFDFVLSGKLICGNCKHRMIGISGTSKTGAVHYYYACQSKQRRKVQCTTRPIQKQFLEDMVIRATSEMLKSVSAIHKVAESIYNTHKAETADNTALKLLERKLKEAVKAQNNIVKAIEQGIITEVTKTRLTELEKEVTSLEFEIAKEKARSYTYLTVEQIEMYLSKFVFENTDDIKVRKLIVNTFIREVILYDDEIVITYTFTDDVDRPKRTKETTVRTEKQIELAENSASSYTVSSSIFSHCPPKSRRGISLLLFYFLLHLIV